MNTQLHGEDFTEEYLAFFHSVKSLKPAAEKAIKRVKEEIFNENKRRFRKIRSRELSEYRAYLALPFYKRLFTSRPKRTHWKQYKRGIELELTNNPLLDTLCMVVQCASRENPNFSRGEYEMLKRMTKTIEMLRQG